MRYEAAIVGAGPLGIEMAVALKRNGVSCLQFDAGQLGHTISWFPPQTRFFSSNERIAIAGVPLETPDQTKATREQYLAYLRSVVRQHDLKINTYEAVKSITRKGDGFALRTQTPKGEESYETKRVILATGGTAWPRRLGVEGESLPHVHANWRDPHDYFGKRVLVIGGKNSAVETALRLHHAGAKVSLSYRKEKLPEKSIKYWLLPEINGYIRAGEIKGLFDTQVVRITPAGVVLMSYAEGELKIDCDFVIPQIGYLADMSLARSAGVELTEENDIPTFDESTMQTNVPGIYLCGTVTGGTQQRYAIFLENGHVNVDRILAHILGQAVSRQATPVYENPES